MSDAAIPTREGHPRRNLLPRGGSLTQHNWLRHHQSVVVLLAAHVVGLGVFGLVRGYSTTHVLLALLPVAAATLAAHLASDSRQMATVAATLGLLTCSTVAIHLSGGATEANFHVFVMLGVISLYRDWTPFLIALVYVLALHLIVGTVNPKSLYDHPSAWDRPFAWATINAGFVIAVSVVNLIAWRQAESATERVANLSRQNTLILDAAAEGIYGINQAGLATFVNPAAARMLGWDPEELIGQPVHEVMHHSEADGTPMPPERCPVSETLRSGNAVRVRNEVFWRHDGTSFPVEYVATPLFEKSRIVGAVVTFDDITERRRADDYERELSRLAQVEHAQREVLHSLQETVRPPKPNVPNTELGVHYLPADDSAPAGGDLYDWQLLPDGWLHVAVIDVAGKGVAATKDALAVAHALRLSALAGRPIGELVVNAGALISAQSPDLVATCLVARYNPETGVVLLAGASHPPALHVTADGEVREVLAPGIAIGWPAAGSRGVVELKLERSDSLILYTDGLVEATKDIQAGLDELCVEAAAVAKYPADLLARALVDRMLSRGSRRDDTLALVLRRRTPPELDGIALGPFEHRFQATPAVVPLARHLLDDWLRNQPVNPDEVEDIPLVVSELCTNAVRAARETVVLRAWAEGDALFIQVEDDGGGEGGGDGLRYDGREMEPVVPDTTLERGRGLFLAEALTDTLDVTVEGTQTIVTVCKRAVLST
ncbi:MAG TPA: SpoIIE family protein phosphatase [Acidimicrobiales bacterium]|nr:SpoIIE family protein phosphatase [Acidimicrobiales bacterium]